MKLFPTGALAFVLVFSVAMLTACAEQMAVKSEDGILVSAQGMTVYTYDSDKEGKSVCYGRCAINWPPVAPRGIVSGAFSVITRDDGSLQLVFKGKPLYLYRGDHEVGERNGDTDVWHIVNP